MLDLEHTESGLTHPRIFLIPEQGFERWRGTENPGDRKWLPDLLHTSFPQCAIHTVSYVDQAELAGLAAINAVSTEDRPATIQQALQEFMEKTPIRERAPVVFVAHRDASIYVEEVSCSLRHRFCLLN